MSDRIEVCPADELDHLDRAFVTVGNREICVFNVDGDPQRRRGVSRAPEHVHTPVRASL